MSNVAYAYKDERNDYDVINGEVYMMAKPTASHARVQRNILGIFDRRLKGKRCESFSEIDVFFSEDDNLVPDVLIVCNPDIVEERGIYGTPDLVVEILSPSTARRDKIQKKSIYEKYGVKEYWIVDPFSKSVEIYLLKDGKFILDDVYSTYRDYEWEALTDEEKANVKKSIKLSIYDDFEVELSDIFDRVK
ncbi:MAG: Uma2 family endonuclease [Selenomonadaceae bacterium]|nr:Uma2 family endonuclease [Selenomonadaceae bacterium]